MHDTDLFLWLYSVGDGHIDHLYLAYLKHKKVVRFNVGYSVLLSLDSIVYELF